MKHTIVFLLLTLFSLTESAFAYEYVNDYSKFSMDIPEDYTIAYESKGRERGLVVEFSKTEDSRFFVLQFWPDDEDGWYDKKLFLNESNDRYLAALGINKWETLQDTKSKGFHTTLYKVGDNKYVKVYSHLADGKNIFIFIAEDTQEDSFAETDDMVSSFNRQNYWGTILLIALGVLIPAILFYFAKENWGKNWRKVMLYGLLPLIVMIVVCLLCDFSLWWVVVALVAGILGEVIL